MPVTSQATASGNKVWPLLILIAALFPILTMTNAWFLSVTNPYQALNSDLIQPFLIMRDFFREPAALADWSLSPAIYVFPDYLIAGLISLLPVHPVVQFILYDGILFTLYAVSGGVLLSGARVSSLFRGTLLTALVMVALQVFASAWPNAMSTNMLIWTVAPFIHSGALWAGVLAIGLWTHIAFNQNKRSKIALFGVLTLAFLASYSDISFLLYFAVPIAVASTILAICQRQRVGIAAAFWLLLASISGLALDLVTRGYIAQSPRPNVIENIERWASMVWPYLTHDALLIAFFVATPVMALRSAFLLKRAMNNRNMTPAEFAEITLAGTQALSLVIPIVSGMCFDIWTIRYSLPIALVPLLWAALLAGRWFNHLFVRRTGVVAASVTWVAAIALAAPQTANAMQTLMTPPAILRCMAQLNLNTGFANYWNAKFPVFMSDYTVHLIQLRETARIYPANTNHRWEKQHVDDGRPIAPNFIAVHELDPKAVELTFGPPTEIKTCLGSDYWIYNETLQPPPWG